MVEQGAVWGELDNEDIVDQSELIDKNAQWSDNYVHSPRRGETRVCTPHGRENDSQHTKITTIVQSLLEHAITQNRIEKETYTTEIKGLVIQYEKVGDKSRYWFENNSGKHISADYDYVSTKAYGGVFLAIKDGKYGYIKSDSDDKIKGNRPSFMRHNGPIFIFDYAQDFKKTNNGKISVNGREFDIRSSAAANVRYKGANCILSFDNMKLYRIKVIPSRREIIWWVPIISSIIVFVVLMATYSDAPSWLQSILSMPVIIVITIIAGIISFLGSQETIPEKHLLEEITNF
ncbi:hypothetical protein LJC45_03125 [Alistipes sp. OttesenSCG-928-B03]|nr:hypothetical protein [Alistipes sp. OttesenSCG-928-B03]